MRGSVTGSLWALMLGVVGLGIASQVADRPAVPLQSDSPVLAAPAPADAAIAATPAVNETAAPVASAEPEPAQVTAPDTAEAPAPETEPSAVPVTPEVETVLEVPAEPTPPDVTVIPDDPVVAETPNPLPAAPDPDETVVAMAEPDLVTDAEEVAAEVATVPDEVESEDSTDAEETPAIAEVETAVTEPQPETEETDPAAVVGDVPDTASDSNAVSVTDEAEATAVDEGTGTVVEAPTDVATSPEPVVPEVAEPSEDQTAALEVAPAPVETVEPAIVIDEPAAAEVIEPAVPAEDPVPAVVVEAPTPVEPAPQAPEEVAEAAPVAPEAAPEPSDTASAGVRINRPGTDESAPAGQESVVIPEDELPEDAPAMLRFAAAFENTEDLPLMSIVLLDDGQLPGAIDAVANLPIPATVILNPLTPDAADRMAAYRAAGIETGMQISLPTGATPIDVEVAFEAAFGTLSESVVLFSGETGLLQSNRSVNEQVMQVLAADGRGLVIVQRGLGNALRAAEQANVPAATVLRDLDGDGQDSAAIGRALDQAAFRARQSGGAVLLARATDETLDALGQWAAADAQVAMAPVTAILKEMTP